LRIGELEKAGREARKKERRGKEILVPNPNALSPRCPSFSFIMIPNAQGF